MTPRRPLLLFKALVALLTLVSPALPAASPRADDTLGDFEKEILEREEEEREKEKDDKKTARHDDDERNAEEDEAGVAAFLALVLALLSSSDETMAHFGERRQKGEPAAALLRLESAYQPLSRTDVDGLVSRAELTWAMLGLGGEFLRYWEETPRQDLDFWSLEGLFRIAPNEYFRLTVAAGARSIRGRESRAGFQGGFSLGVYPRRWLGVEADLRWAHIADRVLGDYRGGLLLRAPAFPYAALRGGYRAIRYGGETLHGAEAGLVLTW